MDAIETPGDSGKLSKMSFKKECSRVRLSNSRIPLAVDGEVDDPLLASATWMHLQ